MSRPFPPARRPWRGRLLALAGVLVVALNLRVAVAAVSPVLDDVRRDVPLTDAQVGLLGTVPVLSFAVFGTLAPPLARRFGLERTVVGAMLLSAAGEVARALVTTPSGFLLCSVLALAGMGMGNVLLPALVKRWFGDRIGAVTAAYAVALSVSTAVPPLVAVPLTTALGWRWAVGCWAAWSVLAAVPWALVLLRGRGPDLQGGAGEVGGVPPSRAAGRVTRSPLAWALAVAFGMNSLVTYVLFAWLPLWLQDAGLPEGAGGAWVALFAILGMPTGLVGPLLAARLRNPVVVVVAFVSCFAAGLVGLWARPADGTAVWVVLAGLGSGTFPVLLALIGLRTRTAAGAAALSGFAQGVGYTLAGVGPVLVGVVHGATGGWGAVTAVLLTCLGVLLVAGALACRPRYLEDEWGGAQDPERPTGGGAALGTLSR